jgi:hypothetical protein
VDHQEADSETVRYDETAADSQQGVGQLLSSCFVRWRARLQVTEVAEFLDGEGLVERDLDSGRPVCKTGQRTESSASLNDVE